MIDPKQVTAVVVTTGEAPLGEVLASLSCFGATVIYDNSILEDHAVFSRYKAILDRVGVVYTQDDDCVLLNPVEICRFYDPALVTCNMPPANRPRYQGQDGMALVGHGAIFHTALVQSAFNRYSNRFPHDALFERECDRVFTALNPTKWVALPLRHLPAATAPTRLHQQGEHEEAFAAIRQRIRVLRRPRQASDGAASPAVSTITIFKDAGPFLRDAIESVIAQTCDDWELMLVDDGSMDGSSEIALEYADAFPEKVRYFEHPHHQNRGKSASRNLGLREARGRYIAYLDADDVWLPQKLDRQIAILESEPAAGMVCGRSLHWDESVAGNDEAPRYHDVLSIAPEQLVKPPLLATATLGLQDVWPTWAGSLIRREVLERLGGSDERFRNVYEHGVLFAKIFLSEQVYLSAECVGKYRIHPRMGSVVAAGAGVWSPYWPNPAHHAYLAWLADYIKQTGVSNRALRSRLRRELRPYRYPRAWTFAKRMSRWSRALAETVDNVRRRLVRRSGGRSRGWIRMAPNPILEYCGGEVATITWGSAGTTETEVRLESPSGQLFSRSGSSGEAVTGPWLREGLRLILCDASNGSEGDRELAAVTVRTLGAARVADLEALGIRSVSCAASSNGESVTQTPSGSIRATPNPVPKLSLGPCQTTLSWASEHTDMVEVHVGAPDGPLFSRSGPSGTATTGHWLTDGMTFFLQNLSENRPLTREHTLARVSVSLAPVGTLDLAEAVRLRELPRFEPATTTLLGRPFRILDGPTFIYMHREIIEEAIYYFQPASDEPYIIDGGSNIGVSVLFFKHLYPRARVVAFEPDADVFAVLCENVQSRGIDDVTLVNAALADADGMAAFVQQGAYASRVAAGSDAATAEVRTVRLRSVLDRRVDLLKLNIEGAETAVIADCADLLDRVDRIVLEYHSLVAEPQILHRLLAVLTNAGFRTYVRSSRTEFMHPLIGFQVHSGMDCQLYVYAIRQ